MNVLIADDETIVLEGLKYIIEWNKLGFSICDTAVNGEDTLHKIWTYHPDLVLLDIRMPKLTGIEVVQKATEGGFTGKFIILSGMSDFKLAQTAMRYGVDFYLTKPIDEDELEHAVSTVRELIQTEAKNQFSFNQYKNKAKQSILQEILYNTCDYYSVDLNDLHLDTTIYQVITYENYNQNFFHSVWNFGEMISVTNQDNNSFDIIEIEQRKVILLKGSYAISKFKKLLHHYQNTPEKGSPFDSVFIAYGQRVYQVSDLHLSYEDIYHLLERRFFCDENQHIIGYEELLSHNTPVYEITKELAPDYAAHFTSYIQSNNTTLLTADLKELTNFLRHTKADITDIKHLLVDIYILVKQKIMQVYSNEDNPFLPNSSVIGLIEGKYYLYEIISFLAEQFKLWTHSVGCSSAENVLDEVLYYIAMNYKENLKLESIAPLFGYNSSYLGKMFSKKLGINFNTHLDQVRIEAAKELLMQDDLKVYEIAEQVGYSNVDYFHRKFKKHMGTSPADYRKNI